MKRRSAIAYRGDLPVGYVLYQRVGMVFKIIEMAYVDAAVKIVFCDMQDNI